MTDHLATPIDDTCRDCGELIPAGAAHLPGYCGPCSIPEEQARHLGRSTEAPCTCPECAADCHQQEAR